MSIIKRCSPHGIFFRLGRLTTTKLPSFVALKEELSQKLHCLFPAPTETWKKSRYTKAPNILERVEESLLKSKGNNPEFIKRHRK